jgi:hypothetical protein
MWNPPDKYVEVVYLDVSGSTGRAYLKGDGEHYRLLLDGGVEEAWCLI